MAANLTRRFPTHFISARPNRTLPSINRDSLIHPLIRSLTTSIHPESDLAIKKEETESKEAAAVTEEGSGEEEEGDEGGEYVNKETGEVGGPKGPEPTRVLLEHSLKTRRRFLARFLARHVPSTLNYRSPGMTPSLSMISLYFSLQLWHISSKIATACSLHSGDPPLFNCFYQHLDHVFCCCNS
ncbi:hypothetical protein Drorol1_Dr00018935 [Drosera rotundifolia]